MSRLLRGIIAAAVVVLIIAGIWQWREYGTKQDLRDDALLYFIRRPSSIWRVPWTDILCLQADSIMI